MNSRDSMLARLSRTCVLAAGLLLGCAPDAAEPAEPPAATERPSVTDWKEIDGLIGDQRYQAAAEKVAALRQQAAASGDEETWLRALIQEVQLRTALHGYEQAVGLLRAETWPETPRSRAVLNLFYAHGLVEYARAYSWEIRQRERIDTGGEVAIGSWTLEQLVAEAHRAYAAVWAERASWGDDPIGALGRYIERNNYPPGIRSTLRDAVGYLWTELLADRSNWTPEQSNGLYRLDLDELLAAGGDGDRAADADAHPLVRIAAVLGDLEQWHLERERPEAASEARLERLRRLHSSFSGADDRSRIRAALERHLAALDRKLPWWSVGQAMLGELVRDEDRPDSLIRAREIALEAVAAHPESIGGRRAAHQVAAIEQPGFSIEAMATDAPGKRSIRVLHKNLETLHFRAYRFDLRAHVARSSDRSLLPDLDEVEALLAGAAPEQSWVVELPPTRDFRMHATYVTPPIGAPGAFVVVASARTDFAGGTELASATTMIFTDLVIVRRQAPSAIEVAILSGASGRPLPGVAVSLWKRDYRTGHRRARSLETNSRGVVTFEPPDRRAGYFLVAERGAEITVDESYVAAGHERERREDTAGLLYSDRSVYRPGQKVLWKLIAYRGEAAAGRYETLAEAEVEVQLVDAGGEVVETLAVATNEFGSASGSFVIPSGRLLGGWRLYSPIGANLGIQVEEYKRPTFEVSILEPESPLRLNRAARLRGEARYYFGLPVVEGVVDWRVEREPVYPHWWFWRPEPADERQVIAGGATGLDPDGRFEIEFVPEADERRSAEPGVTYRYRLTADVTDAGGETRSDSRAFRLGFVAVEAAIEGDAGFLTAGRPAELSISRADLDGRPAPGGGRWRLLEVAQPEAAQLPAEQPVAEPPPAEYATPGDALRERWAAPLATDLLMRLWPDGPERARGELTHGDDGRASLALGALEAGAYRLRYETDDPFGAAYETQAELLVVAGGATRLAAPAVLIAERQSVPVGGTARLFVHSGLENQELELEVFRDGRRTMHRRFDSSDGSRVVEIPVGAELRGGFGVRLTALRDHQLMTLTESILVPWDDRKLTVEFESFRDLLRPGSRERWTVRVRGADGESLARGSAELLAYMYDRSLDIFAPHHPADPLTLYPWLVEHWPIDSTLGSRHPVWQRSDGGGLPDYPHLQADHLKFFDGYPIGGPGRRVFGMVAKSMPMPRMMEMAAMDVEQDSYEIEAAAEPPAPAPPAEGGDSEPPGDALRADFSETAFWEPHLRLDADGGVGFEFTVPDSLTDWSVWVHALTRDLRAGSLQETARSAKELMVRPYLPRFLREGDAAGLQVAVNNGGETELSGVVDLDIVDPATGESVRAEFGLGPERAEGRLFTVAAGGSATLEFPIVAPKRVGTVAFRVTARAGDLSDGELRPLPLLPGRMHLSQSRFVTLRDRDRRELTFAELAAGDDPTRIDEQLVVTLDAQLFYSVLHALPYLVDYPYECTEQTLNRFLSTGIVGSLYDRYPAVARMAEQFAERETRFEAWNDDDPNRKMGLEETPWLQIAAGGGEDDLINVLDPRIARAVRDVALADLERAQTSSGGFPWWPGGPPSPFMTLYLVHGFSKALEFDVEVPREMVVEAWGYLRRHYESELRDLAEDDRHYELVTFLNYVLSNYPDPSWTGGLFTDGDRRQMLELSFRNWRRHSPLIKGYLALTLERAGRSEDARQVWESVMDSARTTRDEGTFWAPEDRAWLWYNDTIESHAFALRVLGELDPGDERRHGLVQWLLLNKKLNHWKSTRATAEVVYSLVHYLRQEGQLGVREAATVEIGPRRREFVFEPGEYTGRKNQIVVRGDEIDPATMATTVVEKETPGFLFASATWHFSTERLPEQGSGDLFAVSRALFRRVLEDDEWVLRPLADGERLETGDQIEVHLAVRARHAAEYVHLRDPRAAGFEPETLSSGYRWNFGIGWFEEVRDSGTNFFFERLPVGEYTLKYRLRAAMSGTFKVAPATLQSMYAPEFTGYSAGDVVSVGE